ncbi:MAG: peptidase M23 family protein [Chloroflexi bacterium OLB14]|nr:MAG: peptidase M23 family protein [Chloroflexi bacterium OLB14]
MFVTKNLYQNDEAWKSTALGNSSETIGSWGCLLTSVTMMLNGIGYNETPATVNEKMKKAGGFQGALFIPSMLPYVWANCAYKDMQNCETTPAPIAYIDEAVAAGKPVILQVDWNKQQGLQTHFVLVKEKKGDDYSIYDPYKYGGDAPDKEVLLTSRYKYNGAKLATEISAVLWFENYSIASPEPPKQNQVPLPAEKFVVYAAEDDLALRAEGSVTGYLWKRLLKNTELISLESKDKTKAKLGVQGQWLHVQDSTGQQGFVAAWYVVDKKVSASTSTTTNSSVPQPSSSPVPSTSPTPSRSPSPAPLPAGALALYPTTQISLRTKPIVASDTLIRYIDPSEQLISLESAEQAIPKIGVENQWVKVKDSKGKEGYVAAWYVKYAGGSTAQANNSVSSSDGAIKVKTTAEGVSLRNRPIVMDSTLLKRVPIGYEFTIAKAGDEVKIGKNNEWVKVKDTTDEGYIAAWFVRR